MIGERKVDIPSYTVTVEEEDSVHFAPESKIPAMLEKTKTETPESITEDTAEEKVEAPAEEKVEAPAEEKVEAPAEETKDESSSTE
jgi:small subunit ribosomal protein S4